MTWSPITSLTSLLLYSAFTPPQPHWSPGSPSHYSSPFLSLNIRHSLCRAFALGCKNSSLPCFMLFSTALSLIKYIWYIFCLIYLAYFLSPLLECKHQRAGSLFALFTDNPHCPEQCLAQVERK